MYTSSQDWERDQDRHCIPPGSEFAYRDGTPMFGWEVCCIVVYECELRSVMVWCGVNSEWSVHFFRCECVASVSELFSKDCKPQTQMQSELNCVEIAYTTEYWSSVAIIERKKDLRRPFSTLWGKCHSQFACSTANYPFFYFPRLFIGRDMTRLSRQRPGSWSASTARCLWSTQCRIVVNIFLFLIFFDKKFR